MEVSVFATLDDLKGRDRSSMRKVLRALRKRSRFTVFEATAEQKLALTLDRIGRRGFVRYTHGPRDFPWCKVELTEAGLAYLDRRK